MRTLRFDRGTLLLENWPTDDVPPGFIHDARVNLYRAPAMRYYDVVLDLHRRKIEYDDQARDYAPLECRHHTDRTPREYQSEAVAAWKANGRRGTVLLPTGAGKTFVAELCIADADRNALVIAPTINLVGQWYDGLKRAFGEPIGVLGGGVHEVHPITVSTYDSAHLHIERYGGRFGLIVFDEVHHLPGRSFQFAAEGAIAPFRLGLTATLERPDGEHERVFDLVGPVVYRKEITELEGDFLAPYRTERITVSLSDDDRIAYDEARRTWRSFIDDEGIRLGGQNGWNNYLRAASRSKRGRASMAAWRESRQLLQGAPAKLRLLDELLRRHRESRVLVFTNDNATVHHISRTFLVPAITHHTDVKERRRWLSAFAEGSLRVLVTSRVLNEGVDIPAADVAIVLSGTGTVREHVQRLGRILRKQEGKQAILYELIVEDTAEESTSDRRRDHVAYRR